MNEKELEVLLQSKTVRDYVLETGWTFTDFQKAALLCHRGLLLRDEYSYLRELGEHTADRILRKQITAYLEGIEKEVRELKENSGKRFVYVLKVREEGGSWDGEYLTGGYFFDWETALGNGKKENASFEIEKHLADDMTVSEDIPRSYYADAGMRFNKDGEAVCFWDRGETSGFDNKRFDAALIEIPNPFERGDIVKYKRIDGQEVFGIVEEDREEWKKRLVQHLARVNEGDACVDFSDLVMGVAFLREDGTFGFSDSVTPLDLERYQPTEEDWINGSIDTLLVCARDIYCEKGYLSMLFEVLGKYRESGGNLHDKGK